MRELRRIMNHYFGIHRISGFILALVWVGDPCVAHAAQQLVLIADQTEIVKLPETPATVVVGNPAVADVTTEGRVMFFHPRGFGVTNVIALDNQGRKLADYRVRVIFEDSFSVSMYSPGSRETFSCRKDCEPMMRIGDQTGFFQNYSSQVSSKNSLAESQALGEDMLTRTNNVPPTIVTVQ